MLLQRSLHQRRFAGSRKRHQNAAFLDAEMRIEFGGEALDDASCLPKLTEGLVGRGYFEADIRAMLGGNWLRFNLGFGE